MVKSQEQVKRDRRMDSAKKMADMTRGKQSRAYRLPEGKSVIRIQQAGLRRFSFIPYTAGKGSKMAAPGRLVPGLPYWVHNGIGPNEETFLCAAKMFQKPCAVCEQRARLLRDEDDSKEELIRSLSASQRELWNVLDMDDKDKGVQVWDYSDFLFFKYLRQKMDAYKKYQMFADPDNGLILNINAAKAEKGPWYVCSDIECDPRKALSDELLDQAVNFEGCLVETPYDELKAVFLQTAGAGADEASTSGGHEANGEHDERRDDDRTAARNRRRDDDDEPATKPAEDDVDGKDGDAGNAAENFGEGDTVAFTYKGKDYTGTITEIDTDNDLARVEVEGRDRPFNVALADLTEAEADDDTPAGNDKDDDDQGGDAGGGDHDIGDFVKHKGERYEVIKVGPDGLMTLEHLKTGDIVKGIKPSQVEGAAASSNGKKDEDDQPLEEPEKPKPSNKPKAKGKK